MGQKRPREAPAQVTERTEVYDDLAHVDEQIRLKAARTLITKLLPEADVDQLKEILRRLIRGLCSGRKAARLGFSVALTEFLVTLLGAKAQATTRFEDVSGVVDTLIDQTRVSGGVDGQEDRDHQIGRLFGAEAILKSGILFQSDVSNGISRRILDVVYELAKKKPWLREQCGFVLFQSLEIPARLEYAQSVIDKLCSTGLAKSPEGIAIWIGIQKRVPSVNLPNGVWHGNSPLHQKEKAKLALVLKEASVSNLDDVAYSEANAIQKSSWSANVHFAWLVVITELLSESDSKSSTKPTRRLTFSDFWNDCVEDGLFKSTSSDERKYWGLLLLQRGLSLASTPVVVSSLFSFKLMQCLTNHLASSERYLHRAAEKTRKMIVERAQTSLDMKIMILEALLMNGFIEFDKLSKTRTIEELVSDLDEAATLQICEIYNAMILQPGLDDEKSAAQRRQIAADQLVSALKSIQTRSQKAKLDEESSKPSISRVLSLLARFAYFDLGPKAQPEISTSSRDVFRARISSCLTYLAANAKDPSVFPYHLTRVISKRENIPEGDKLLIDAEGAVQEVLDESTKTILHIVKEVESSHLADKRFFRSALSLMSLTFLQVYNGDLEAVGMLEELNETFSKKRLKQYAKRGFHSSTALVEILLALVAKPSKLFRRISLQVFESIAEDVDDTGLQSMLKILETKESLEGQDALFEKENNDEEAGEEDIDSDASNVDMTDVKMISQSDQESDEAVDTASSSADGDDGDGLNEDVAAFNAKLAQALGTRPGNEDLNVEDSDISDEDMNDEEMEALDKHLENVFREQKKAASKKTEQKDAKKTITDFKCRVLELLEILIKKQHRKPLAFLLISPALNLLRTTSSQQVSQKARTLLREYSRFCKGKELPQIENANFAFQMLESVHQEASKTGSNAHASACSQASLLLVRVLAGHDPQQLRRIVDIYAATYSVSRKAALVKKNSMVKISFFAEFDNWLNSFRNQNPSAC